MGLVCASASVESSTISSSNSYEGLLTPPHPSSLTTAEESSSSSRLLASPHPKGDLTPIDSRDQPQHHNEHNRMLQNSNWDAVNRVIYNAVIHLPDTKLEASGLTLSVKNLQCTHLKVSSMSLSPQPPTNNRDVSVVTTISGLDMDCTARYSFDGFLIVNGDGDLYLQSLQNAAALETVFTSVDYTQFPPTNSYVASCHPTVNINEIDFSNGGFWGWTLEQLEGMFRGRFEDMAEARLCEELEALFSGDMDAFLQETQALLAGYPETMAIDPLASEQELMLEQQQQALLVEEQLVGSSANGKIARLVNWQQPESYPFGFWMDQAWDDTVAFLNQPVERPDQPGIMDMNANQLLRDNVLEPGTGSLKLDLDDSDDQVLYEKHDEWLQTKIKLHQITIMGLDSLTLLDPLETIGNYTLQNKLSWESLSVELDVSVEITPSTLPNAQVSAGSGADLGIKERITVQFALNEVNANIAVMLALDQDLVEALKVGHFLDKDNILPCFLSSIYELELSALTVEAIDLQPPEITGFVSDGLDTFISNVITSGFLMYESTMLRRSKAFFQLTIRQIVNVALEAQYESFGESECQLWPLALPNGTVDVRELLLAPDLSIAAGGAGNSRYGNLFADFVMPTLQRELLDDGNINERIIRPLTLDQSGEVGTLQAPAAPWVDYSQDGQNGTSWVGLLGWNELVFKAFDAKVQNTDTIMAPVKVMNPLGSNSFSNTILIGDYAGEKPLRFSTRMLLLGKTSDDSTPDMINEIEAILTVPSALFSFDAEVTMDEISLLDFPLKDLDNELCWLATLKEEFAQKALDVKNIASGLSAFSLEAKCVSCSSPGGEALPEILNAMERANFTTLFRPYLEGVLAEFTHGLWDNMNFPKMVQGASKFCPHHADYDPQAVATDEFNLFTATANPPQWSRQSMETISAASFLGAYSGLFVLAKNQLLKDVLRPTAVSEESMPSLNQSLSTTNLDRFQLLDWTDLSATLGPWANTALEEARELLRGTIEGESVKGRRMLNNIFDRTSSLEGNSARRRVNESRLLQTNVWIRDYLLDEDKSLTFNVDDVHLNFAGITFSLLSVRMRGIDTVTQLDPFVAVGPQTLENNIQLDALNITFEFAVQMGLESHKMNMDIAFSDVAIELPLLLAFDIDKLGQLELENVLQVSKILACLLPGAREVHIPKLSVSVGRMEQPAIEGFFSPSLQDALNSVNQGLFDSFGDELVLAVPGLFDATIRQSLNTKLEQYMSQQDPNLCKVDAGGGVIDFRDLLLPEVESTKRGGSGGSPYGDLVRTFHEMLNEELSTDALTHSPTINSLLASWTEGESGVEGALYASGNLVNTTASVKLGGLDATFGFLLDNVSIVNIDSFGAPLAILDPVEAILLNNTISFGTGPDPMKIAARLVLSITDNGKHNRFFSF